MTNRRMNPRRGFVPLSIAFTIGTAACTSPTPVIRQPYSNGGSPGDGGSGFGTGGSQGSFPGSMGGSLGGEVLDGGSATGAGGASGAGGAMAAGGGSTGAGGGTTDAGGVTGAGGRLGTGGVMGRGGAPGGAGGAGGVAMVDAGRVDTGGNGGMPTAPDAPLEVSSLDLSPPPPVDMGPAPNPMACMKSTWVAAASLLCTDGQCLLMMPSRKEPKYAVDGDLDTRYTSGSPQGSKGAETVTITFPSPITFTGVTIVSEVGDGAAAYRLESSDDGQTFRAFVPPVEGIGSDNIVVTFAAKTMKALRIVQTGMKAGPWWSIHELSVTGCTVAP